MLLLATSWYLNIETRLISELFSHWATRPAASVSKRVLACRCSVQESRIRSYIFAKPVVHQELTRCASTCNFMVLFEYWNQINFWILQSLGNKACSLSLKAGFGAPVRCSVQDSRIRSYFFAMLAVVHRELTDGSYKWFRKGARKCLQWPFLLDIVQKAF